MITPIIIKVFSLNISYIWIYGLFPFLTFLLVNRSAYSSGKSTIYGRKLDFLMIAYYAIISIMAIWYFRMSPKGDLKGYAALYIVIVGIYGGVGIIEKTAYGRKDMKEMKEFLFFKTNYNISSMRDVIENSIWDINDVKEFNVLYKSSKGFVASLSNCLRFSMATLDRSISVAISKESGKYIFQDEQTVKIHEKLSFIFSEILNFKRIEKDQVGKLMDMHRDLWLKYAGAHSRFSETVRKRKGQIASFVVLSIIIIIPAVFLSKLPSDSNLADYVKTIAAAIIGASIVALFPRKSKHEL